MSLSDLYLNYECVICKCHSCDRGDFGADAKHMDELYGLYIDNLQKQQFSRFQRYEAKCVEVSKYLSDAIGVSSLAPEKKEELKTQLTDADFITIVFVLGELEILLG